MDSKLTDIAATVGLNPEVAEKLDQILVGPNDRAYLVCSFAECRHSLKGRCTIFTVLDVPRMKRSAQPCEKYEAASSEG